MNRDLFEQLQAYGEQLDTDQEPITIDEALHPLASRNGQASAIELLRSEQPANDYQEVDIMLMKDSPRAPKRSQLMMGMAAAAVLILGVFAILSAADNDDSDVSTDVPITEPDSSSTTSTSTIPATTAAPAPPAQVVEEIPSFGSVPADATYGTDLLGTPLTFFLPEDLEVTALRHDYVALVHDGQGVENFGVEFRRIPEFFVDVATENLDDWPETGIDGNDLDAWLASASIIVSADRQIEVDGRPARAIDFTVDAANTTVESDDAPCQVVIRPCYYYGPAILKSDGTPNRSGVIATHFRYRFIHIPIAGEDPILVVLWSVGATTAGKADDFEADLVSTLSIG